MAGEPFKRIWSDDELFKRIGVEAETTMSKNGQVAVGFKNPMKGASSVAATTGNPPPPPPHTDAASLTQSPAFRPESIIGLLTPAAMRTLPSSV